MDSYSEPGSAESSADEQHNAYDSGRHSDLDELSLMDEQEPGAGISSDSDEVSHVTPRRRALDSAGPQISPRIASTPPRRPPVKITDSPDHSKEPSPSYTRPGSTAHVPSSAGTSTPTTAKTRPMSRMADAEASARFHSLGPDIASPGRRDQYRSSDNEMDDSLDDSLNTSTSTKVPDTNDAGASRQRRLPDFGLVEQQERTESLSSTVVALLEERNVYRAKQYSSPGANTAGLLATIKALKEEKREQQNSLEAFKQSQSMMVQRCKSMADELKNAQAETKAANERAADLHRQLAQAQHRIKDLEADRERADERHAIEQRRSQDSFSRDRDLHDAARLIESENEDLRAQSQGMQARLETADHRIRDLQEAIRSLEDDSEGRVDPAVVDEWRNKYQAEYLRGNQLQLKVLGMEQATKELSLQCETITSRAEAYQQAIDTKHKEAQLLSVDLQKKQSANMAHQRELREVRQQMQSLYATLQEYESRWQKLAEKGMIDARNIDSLETALRNLQSEYDSESEKLKEQVAQARTQYSSTSAALVQSQAKSSQHEAQHVQALSELNAALRKLENELQSAKLAHDDSQKKLEAEHALRNDELAAYRRERRKLELDFKQRLAEKDQLHENLRNDINNAEIHLEADKASIRELEDALRKAGAKDKSQPNYQTAIYLEHDRLQREHDDYRARYERAKAEVQTHKQAIGQLEAQNATLSAEKGEAEKALSTQIENRLSITAKLDDTQARLQRAKAAYDTLKESTPAKVRVSDTHLTGQVTERNKLLETALTAIEEVLGTGSARTGIPQPKPSQDFTSFSRQLQSKLKNLAGIKAAFRHRASEIEEKFVAQLAMLRKEQDSKLKLIDRIETQLKAAQAFSQGWRAKVAARDEENATLRAEVEELRSNLVSFYASTGAEPVMALRIKYNKIKERLRISETRLIAAKATVVKGNENIKKMDVELKARDDLLDKYEEDQKLGAEQMTRLQHALGRLQIQVDRTSNTEALAAIVERTRQNSHKSS
ncbi:uncharacterized protein L969DRAFT_54641 [Mixia osmundae IAM 14324]|uniref:Uncharacterized protein n=1 Tax=Mixia osmundae (strain CBS 9802 / IAM 14324 / JCM 22182 / KY 12970) TaxID=764103 RepID=G7E1U9_MIXOS|nr:uncharacterized protein L969DRAFT_54641 [Mixia osmundae IAM 14324]KEI36755.1 hypothetical protein L969DRAFT_54641 [Mixia osmundae IAM 14324]GAA96809.1 hypothetical protein E5Q_03481 [Mixia osmundae IAM 14324]